MRGITSTVRFFCLLSLLTVSPRTAGAWVLHESLAAADASFLGENADDFAGAAVSGAGDVDGDGLDDLLVAAPNNDLNGAYSGQVYLVFGQIRTWSMDIDLANAGASYVGEVAADYAGTSVSGGGDVNGDGFDDIVIGAPYNDQNGAYAGKVYVVFGKPTGWGMAIDLANADASFVGEVAGDQAGISVAMAGDLDGDGYDDFLIGAHYNDEGVSGGGQTYVVFGDSGGWSLDVDLGGVGASFLSSFRSEDQSGAAVAGAGDVNGDGYDDMLISAAGNDAGLTRVPGSTG